jgi:catechol 2,3-dioxygenase-like lactoylglutathione lyase family enzyme
VAVNATSIVPSSGLTDTSSQPSVTAAAGSGALPSMASQNGPSCSMAHILAGGADIRPPHRAHRLDGSPHRGRRSRDNEVMADLVTKLVPILHVADPDAERRFYEHLGLRTTYEGPEYPGFIAVGNDSIEFGLSRRAGTDPAAATVTWQLAISDVDAAIAACERSGLSFEVETERPREDWSYRIIKVRSPSGMEVLLEEQVERD